MVGSGGQNSQSEEELQTYQICRLFLASLQLANNGNVRLQHSANDSEDLELVIIDDVLANKKLECYLAPSLSQSEKENEGIAKTTIKKAKIKKATR